VNFKSSEAYDIFSKLTGRLAAAAEPLAGENDFQAQIWAGPCRAAASEPRRTRRPAQQPASEARARGWSLLLATGPPAGGPGIHIALAAITITVTGSAALT
jgi:hypothetical protein